MNIVNLTYDQLYMFVESIRVLSTCVRMDQPYKHRRFCPHEFLVIHISPVGCMSRQERLDLSPPRARAPNQNRSKTLYPSSVVLTLCSIPNRNERKVLGRIVCWRERSMMMVGTTPQRH